MGGDNTYYNITLTYEIPYNADILEGDIITEIDGEKTRNKQDFNTTLHSLPTQGSIVLTILRNGEKIKKEVKF